MKNEPYPLRLDKWEEEMVRSWKESLRTEEKKKEELRREEEEKREEKNIYMCRKKNQSMIQIGLSLNFRF